MRIEESNPRIPSRLGCGGLLLLMLGLTTTPFSFSFVFDMTQGGLVMGQEGYRIGEIWWLVGPLGILSVVVVFRLAYGHRDWLATVVAAAWVGISLGYALTTRQLGFLTLTGLIFVLIASGTWTRGNTQPADPGFIRGAVLGLVVGAAGAIAFSLLVWGPYVLFGPPGLMLGVVVLVLSFVAVLGWRNERRS